MKTPFSPPDIPNIATGNFVPAGVQEKLIAEERERESIRKQHRHDFIIATYGIVGGFVSGLLSSIIFYLIAG